MRYALLLLVLACSVPAPRAPVPSPELNPSFAKVEPWLGDAHWIAVDGAIRQRARFDAILVPGNLVDHVTAARLQPQYARAGD